MAMKVFNAATVLGSADVNEYLVNTRVAFKSADETRSNTGAMASDADLTVRVDASKTYRVDVVLLYHSNNVANFKWGFGLPAGLLLYGTTTGFNTSAVFTTNPYNANVSPGIGNSMAGQDPFDSVVTWGGVAVTGGSSGNLLIKWSQDTSGGFATKLMASSSLILRRVS